MADAAGLARTVIRIGHDDPALGDAVALDGRLAEQSRTSLEERGWKRSRTADEDAHVREIGRIFIQPVAQSVVHGRDPEEHRAALGVISGELGNHGLGGEGDEGRAAPAQQRAVQAHAEAVEVEQRKRVHEHVARRPSPDLERAATLGEEVAVVEHRALGAARRAGRVEDGGRTVGRQRGLRWDRAFRQLFEGNHA